MNSIELEKRFFELVPSHPPNAWEIEEYMEQLGPLPDPQQKIILDQVPVIWPVSHALCYSYLSCAGSALACLHPNQLSQWVAATLDIYERDGLHEAQMFMANVESNFLCRIRGEAGILLSDVAPRLTPYAHSIAERKIAFATGHHMYTDTETIFLPHEITLFQEEEDNFLLYKLMVTFQLGLLRCNTYDFSLPLDQLRHNGIEKTYGKKLHLETILLEDFFSLFPEPRLGEDLFTLVEGMRVNAYLAANFPGIWRDTARLRTALAKFRPSLNRLTGKARIIEVLYRYAMTGKPISDGGFKRSIFDLALAALADSWSTPEESATRAMAIYALLEEIGGLYDPVESLPYLGRLHPAEAMNVRLKRREETKENFIKALAAILLPENQPAGQEDSSDKAGIPAPKISGDEGVALMISQQKDKEDVRNKTEPNGPIQFLTVGGLDIEIPEPLRMLGDQILDDLGHIPNEYIAAAQGMAGRAAPTTQAASTPTGESLVAPLTYDEWDFRRAGFRKDWCILRQRRILPVKGTFVANTLEKYRGLLMQLKKQFEMLRCQERFVKGQRDGDDIDLDAVIESISDTRAGRAASERLFVKLLRDERNIAVLFLVDMSSSTEGWVSQALKEALILMGEALEVLGDRYARRNTPGWARPSDMLRA